MHKSDSSKTSEEFDLARARRAMEKTKRLQESDAFDNDKSASELIREWRDKRARQILGEITEDN